MILDDSVLTSGLILNWSLLFISLSWSWCGRAHFRIYFMRPCGRHFAEFVEIGPNVSSGKAKLVGTYGEQLPGDLELSEGSLP